MRIIGLTGGSGTGKGTFAALLRDKGAGWVDADAVYRTLCARKTAEMLAALDAAFGGVLDRKRCARPPEARRASCLPTRQKLRQLNAKSPCLTSARRRWTTMRAQGDCPFVLYDAADAV